MAIRDRPDKRPLSIRCKAHIKTTGKQCPNWSVHGCVVCWKHGGNAPHVKAAGAVRNLAAKYTGPPRPTGRPAGNNHSVRREHVRAELMNWSATDTTVDPSETLLRLISQSSHRVVLYSDLLEQQYAKAATGDATTTLPSQIGVLIGRKYALNKEGRPVPVEEAIRGLVELEGIERDRCAAFCKAAIAAGLADRQIRVAERAGVMMADMLRAVLGDPALGLSAEQRAAIPGVIRARLSLVS